MPSRGVRYHSFLQHAKKYPDLQFRCSLKNKKTKWDIISHSDITNRERGRGVGIPGAVSPVRWATVEEFEWFIDWLQCGLVSPCFACDLKR